jgi:hypothetical protein
MTIMTTSSKTENGCRNEISNDKNIPIKAEYKNQEVDVSLIKGTKT